LKREPYRDEPYGGRSKTLQSMHKREPDSDIDSTWARREPIRPIPTYKPTQIKPLMALPTYFSNPQSTPKLKREPYPEPDWDEAYTLFQREPEPEPWGEDMEEL